MGISDRDLGVEVSWAPPAGLTATACETLVKAVARIAPAWLFAPREGELFDRHEEVCSSPGLCARCRLRGAQRPRFSFPNAKQSLKANMVVEPHLPAFTKTITQAALRVRT